MVRTRESQQATSHSRQCVIGTSNRFTAGHRRSVPLHTHDRGTCLLVWEEYDACGCILIDVAMPSSRRCWDNDQVWLSWNLEDDEKWWDWERYIGAAALV